MRILTFLEDGFDTINNMGEATALTVMIMIGGGLCMGSIFLFAYLEKAVTPISHQVAHVAKQHTRDPKSPVYHVHTMRFGKPRTVNTL